VATHNPGFRRPDYGDTAECAAYNVGYCRGYTHRGRLHTMAARWPNAYFKGYWDGYADNPRGRAVA
jgi:hypothetical protein